MSHPRRSSLVLFSFLFIATMLSADSSKAEIDLKEGTELFRNGQYDKAVLIFHDIVIDPQAEAQKPDAYLLMAKSYMALGRLEDAERSLEFYVSNYSSAPEYPEALYQKGRLLFLQDDYEASLQVLQGFLAKYPKSAFVPNAWFWAGECLYGLGRLDEAQKVYKEIVTSYPTSFKVEAAQYKLSLIELRRKEIELSKLLKWSHEEFLKSIEEFQRREKTYEQAIEVYQKRLAGMGASDDFQTISDLRAEIERKTAEINRLTAQLGKAGAPAAQGDQSAELARMRRLLEIKQEALALKERYLAWLEASVEASR